MYYVMAEFVDEHGHTYLLRKGRMFKTFYSAAALAMKQKGVSEVHVYGRKPSIVAAYRNGDVSLNKVA